MYSNQVYPRCVHLSILEMFPGQDSPASAATVEASESLVEGQIALRVHGPWGAGDDHPVKN